MGLQILSKLPDFHEVIDHAIAARLPRNPMASRQESTMDIASLAMVKAVARKIRRKSPERARPEDTVVLSSSVGFFPAVSGPKVSPAEDTTVASASTDEITIPTSPGERRYPENFGLC
jgi:hypothetical protein